MAYFKITLSIIGGWRSVRFVLNRSSLHLRITRWLDVPGIFTIYNCLGLFHRYKRDKCSVGQVFYMSSWLTAPFEKFWKIYSDETLLNYFYSNTDFERTQKCPVLKIIAPSKKAHKFRKSKHGVAIHPVHTDKTRVTTMVTLEPLSAPCARLSLD